MDSFSRLPLEVLLELFSWLKPRDVISISKTCHLFHNAATVDKLWANVCHNEFGIKLKPSTDGFVKRFYKNVLYQYGPLLGLWTKVARDEDRYGSLIKILYCYRQLFGVDLQPPKVPHLKKPLRPKLIFIISMDESNNDSVVVNCCIDPENLHICELDYKEQTKTTPTRYQLTRRCSKTAMGYLEHVLDYHWCYDRKCISDHVDTTVSSVSWSVTHHFADKCRAVRNTDYLAHYSRLELPSSPPGVILPIQPGIFKGTTTSEGIQLLLLSYENDGNKITGRKITGDSDIPAGKISFEADLRCCMYLNQEMQSDMQSIDQIAAVFSDVLDWNDLPQPQPFMIPQNCERQFPDIPKNCLTRFHGVGTFGFIESDAPYPSSVKGHWIAFNQDLFGFLWIVNSQRGELSVYHRVNDPIVTSRLQLT